MNDFTSFEITPTNLTRAHTNVQAAVGRVQGVQEPADADHPHDMGGPAAVPGPKRAWRRGPRW
jgi:hypothetical protein